MKFKPPTIEEVRTYIKEKGYHTVDAEFFMEFYESADWHDSKGKKVKSWKQKLVTWNRCNIELGRPARLCRVCKKYGEYTGKDDTGQVYWLCADHKPKRKNVLPKELTENIGKIEHKVVNINNERNRQKDKLGIR